MNVDPAGQAAVPRRVVVFCRVVDNVGDAGVCWRLARQLAVEHRRDVTLYVDHVDVMRPLWPADAATAPPAPPSPSSLTPSSWTVDGVRVRRWPAEDADWDLPAGTLLLSTFGCELPASLRERLGAATMRADTIWINVEHLSAETWIESAHRRTSVKPSDGAVEHYFFPGFTEATGGLLREADLPARQAALAGPAAREARLRAIGAPAAAVDDPPLTISLFCYPVDAVADLLECLAAHARPIRLVVPDGVAAEPIGRFFGRPLTRDGGPLARGALQAASIRWLDQRGYDDLLHACDLNFVRGEDSWIRAHWAGRPFVWQPYPQETGTRRVKLDAWLDRLTADWPADGAAATRALHHAWIGDRDLRDAWPAFVDWAASRTGADRWQAFQMSLRQQRDLASQLMEFTRALAAG